MTGAFTSPSLPGFGTAVTFSGEFAQNLATDLLRMHRDTAIDLEKWPAARRFLDEVRPGWADDLAPAPLALTEDPATWPTQDDVRPDLRPDLEGPATAPVCGEREEYGFWCTRPKLHSGPHVALGAGDQVCEVWA